ncbi:helix-turn-helix transcriptional regulator [Williamsia sp.]|uniref:helix-turn-helix transcriptional regulator n=1 Tax=Williamsia sp. TaxID=1872085 RepID=UPI001A28D1C9|nr:LuxR family transcriptional regulator [Williamsia sp.]MBJ7289979.1 AAA family ATPase [Williamsia sp.]
MDVGDQQTRLTARSVLADDGATAAVVITGDPGIGKTTAWFDVVDTARAQGFRVLAARPVPTESVLPFASLADLLGDIAHDMSSELPDPQRIAIDRALLRIDTTAGVTDRRAVSAGFLAIVERLAATSPVLVAIDDLQWLDAPTRSVIGFAARRFSDRVRLVCAVRSDDFAVGAGWLETSRPGALVRVELGPLDRTALHRVLAARFGRTFTLSTVARIHWISGGNPFYAIELALSSGSWVNDASFPGTLVELVADRIDAIAQEGREVLFVAACVAEPTVGLVARVLDLTTTEVDRRVDDLESDGILAVDGSRLRFDHPLFARGVYAGADPGRRRAMHRRLADVVEQPELRARHLALAATGSDEQAVTALDVAADLARRRGAPDTAAELLGLALRLGGDTPGRRIVLAQDHFNAGDIAQARELLDDLVTRTDTGVHRVAALGLLAVVRMFDDSLDDALDLLGQALALEDGASPVRAELLIAQAFAFANSQRVDAGVRSADDAVELARRIARADLESRALGMRTTLRFMRGDGLDTIGLRRAIETESRAPGVPIAFRPRAQHAILSAWVGDLDIGRSGLEAMRRECAEHGEEIELAFIAFHAAIIDIWRGDLGAARREAAQMAERARQLGGEMPEFVARTIGAMASAYAGVAEPARRDALAALEVARRWGSSTLSDWPRTVLGFLEVSTGRHENALDILAPMIADIRADPGTIEIITASFLPDAIEALVHLGRLDEADELTGMLERAGRRHDRAWTLAVGSRCRSAVSAARGDLPAALAAGTGALTAHARLAMPFELARTQLVVGEVHRRARHKEQAASLLAEARTTFSALGGALWAARADEAIARVGVGARSTDALTPSEQRVAELAAAGMINRDIASALFISPKTVEANLARIYRKFGIHSRAELGARIGSI